MVMQPIRVLVVDDSALMRQMISRILTDAGMEVVATARDGIDALEKVVEYRPDVVTLDVEMPRMDGLTTLRHLMAQMPLPVVMVSSLTAEQAPAAVEALSIGAVDVVGKPGGTISLNINEVADEIVRKVRGAAGARVIPGRGTGVRRRGEADKGIAGPNAGSAIAASRDAGPGVGSRAAANPGTPRATTLSPEASGAAGASLGPAAVSVSEQAAGAGAPGRKTRRARGQRETPLVIVGSSTGGPKALTQLLKPLPADFPAPIVIVQHMPAGFTKALADRLNDLTALRVAEAAEGHTPMPGEVWVAKGGVHLTFGRFNEMREDMSPPHLGVRPAVDVTLESAVERWGDRLIVVILTGMGLDGARGCRKVKQAGGVVLAQDEESSVIYGMPRAVAEMGLADRIVSIDDMPEALEQTVAAVMSA